MPRLNDPGVTKPVLLSPHRLDHPPSTMSHAAAPSLPKAARSANDQGGVGCQGDGDRSINSASALQCEVQGRASFVSPLSPDTHSTVPSPFPETRRNPRKQPIWSRERENAARIETWFPEGDAPLTYLQIIAHKAAPEASSPARRDLLRDTQELLAPVATFEQPPQRRRRIIQATLHVNHVLELSEPAPSPRGAPIASAARDT